MYFPYLRGRQYELLALRELQEKELIGDKVIPIIEPVKLSPTLIKTIETYIKFEKGIALILNPQVGSFNNDTRDTDDGSLEKYINILTNPLVIKSLIMNNNVENEVYSLLEKGLGMDELLIVNDKRDLLDKYVSLFSDEKPMYNLIPDESAFRRKAKENKVIFEDRFEKKVRNVDYHEIDDEFFSESHLFYKEEGYLGFSDYSIVGNEYSESGFAPYAVAIHIVYFSEDKSLRIKHFVSDSNEDMKNPAKKFYEAVTKLAEWQGSVGLDTYGINEFMNHFKNKTYPGLGSVKKLSLMHHIELINKYLEEVKA